MEDIKNIVLERIGISQTGKSAEDAGDEINPGSKYLLNSYTKTKRLPRGFILSPIDSLQEEKRIRLEFCSVWFHR